MGPTSPANDSRRRRYILTLVNNATRYSGAVSLKNIDPETVAEALLDMLSQVKVSEEVLRNLETQHKTNFNNTSTIYAVILRVNTRLFGMGWQMPSWAIINRLRSGVKRFFSFMRKNDLSFFSNCEKVSTETAYHKISQNQL